MVASLADQSMIGMEERRHISDTRRRYFPDAKGKPILPRAASDGEMGGRAGRPMARAMSKDWEERARLKEKPELAMLPIPEKPDQKHSVSFGGIHQDTVEIDAETDMTGKMSSVRAGKTTRAASRVSKGSAANKVAQIKTIRCSVEREEAFSQLRQNQMGERYGKKGTFGSREKIIATVTVAVHSAWLEWCTLMFTVLSAVLVGWEVDRGVESGADMHFALVFFKHLTTFVFLLEIAARITAQGKEFFNPDGDDIGWHILEVIMVAAGLIEFIVDCAGLAGQAGFLVVVRIGRAARLLRIHRVLHQVPALRMIYHSMLATTRSLFWAIAMLLIVIYCFAIVFQQAVNDYTGSQSQDAVSETFGLFFPSILRTALTLMQACTGGLAWADVERSLAEIHWIWVVMFGLYFCLVYFALMNVVTAVFCSSAVERANQDQEAAILDELQKESQYTESLQNLFASMDSNDDGKVSILEFEEKFADPRIEATLLGSMGIDEDMDKGREFVSQGLRLKGNALRIDVERTYAALKRQNFMMEELHEQMGELQGLCQTLSENAAASTRTNPASAYLA
ncbi:hypothetical protein AK812_SmicGene10632 [Symbiodinium microadriaticum]|uniref:EF-hand domain-containing protein n=1 Tax=Symbiodinium microadriaticum TaxID=2951 RepID=A0A1Q9EFC6_SYMMI|nr:hypothetical protein AK812_SmicGene10632 [Symbiodinium microadriaticum]